MGATVLQQLELAGIPAEKKGGGWIARLRAYQKDAKNNGGLITKGQAAALLELSTGRVSQLLNQGLLLEFEHFGKKLVSANQCEALHRAKREGGAQGRLISKALKATFKG